MTHKFIQFYVTKGWYVDQLVHKVVVMAHVWTFPVPVLEVIDLNVALMKDNQNQGFSDLIKPFQINGKRVSYNTLRTQKELSSTVD